MGKCHFNGHKCICDNIYDIHNCNINNKLFVVAF